MPKTTNPADCDRCKGANCARLLDEGAEVIRLVDVTKRIADRAYARPGERLVCCVCIHMQNINTPGQSGLRNAHDFNTANLA